MMPQPSFEEYRAEWLRELQIENPSTTELGHRFARKLVTQWLDIDDSQDDIVYCDGAGDGGIDVAFLHRADTVRAESEEALTSGDVWYLVQSKYGTAFRGSGTLLEEAQKVIDTLDGQRTNLSSLAQGLLERLRIFISQASELDKIVLVFATEEPLTRNQQRVLDDIRNMGRGRLGHLFDVEDVSIATIYQRLPDEKLSDDHRIKVQLNMNLVESGKDLLVGAISLFNLYGFLKAYRNKAHDIDRLYEKNVRRFLGSKGKVNKSMHLTLQNSPEQFGLYNNGITIVVENFHIKDGVCNLTEPYIVNGCQTTRTIWEVFHQRTDSGGTGINIDIQDWKSRAKQAVVVAKIVRVGADGDSLLQNITRYTNSQNAVREKDFLALTSDFRNMAQQMSEKYNVFLENQRGGWDSQRAYQRQHPNEKQFTEHTNAFDLIKVYGAGWLGEPGTAFGRNADFLPSGAIFRQIFEHQTAENGFTVDDFYAAYCLQRTADGYKFGRQAEHISRKQTRYLFYLIAIDLIKGVMVLGHHDISEKNITRAMIKMYLSSDDRVVSSLMNVAIETIDEYLNPGSEESVFKEPAFQEIHNNNLNNYIKWDRLGKDDDASPNLRKLLAITKRTLSRGNPSPKELVLSAISS